TVFSRMLRAVKDTLAHPKKDLAAELANSLVKINTKDVLMPNATAGMATIDLPIFHPVINIYEALSPIGLAHYYRQLYFNAEEGVGPLEEAFTIAPLETLEVVYETVRRQIHEELVEVGSETVSEAAVETKNL